VCWSEDESCSSTPSRQRSPSPFTCTPRDRQLPIHLHEGFPRPVVHSEECNTQGPNNGRPALSTAPRAPSHISRRPSAGRGPEHHQSLQRNMALCLIRGETPLLFVPISLGLGLSGWAPPLPATHSQSLLRVLRYTPSVATATATMTKSKSRRGGGGVKQGSGGPGGGTQAKRKSPTGPPPTGRTEAAGASATPTTTTPTVTKPRTVTENTDTASQDDDTGMCWICAEPVKYHSVSGCNHRTCHVCALRLRALYKRRECIFCKVRLPHTETRPN